MSQVILQAENISFRLLSQSILKTLNLAVFSGELVGLIGPNGAGKSTLLKLLAGLLSPTTGQIYFNHQALDKMDKQQKSRQLAWVEQQGPIHWPLTVERLVSLGRVPHLAAWQTLDRADFQATEAALMATDLISLRHRDATTLSGGERSRVLLARALAVNPELLLADEPIAALDLAHQLQTMELLREFAQNNKACVVVLHDLSLAARFCDRLYLLQAGEIIAQGTVSEVLNTRNLKNVYGVECSVGCDTVPWIIPIRRL